MAQKQEIVGVTESAIGVVSPKTVLFSLLHSLFRFLLVNGYDTGAPGGAVGSGKALQVGRSRVRFPMV